MIVLATPESSTPLPPPRKFQFGLGTFLVVSLALGPILAWAAIKLGFVARLSGVNGHIAVQGRPMANGTISFIAPDGSFVAKTTTDSQGNFTFKSGLPAGNYLISVDGGAQKYRSALTSGLTISVRDGTNTIGIELGP
jgi:hypothetical protein